MPEPTTHYFDTEPGPAGPRREFELDLAGRTMTVATAGGVFSRDRLDPGTAVLLRTLARTPPPPPGPVLDLGCGWGPIALSLAATLPRTPIWAVDVNPRALELTAANAAANGLSGVRTATPDQVPANLEFTALWSNPPVRIGKDALHDLLRTWLPRLAPNGCAWLVVQRNLGADSLQRWLVEDLAPQVRTEHGPDLVVTRPASSKGYRVFQVERRS